MPTTHPDYAYRHVPKTRRTGRQSKGSPPERPGRNFSPGSLREPRRQQEEQQRALL